MSAPVVLLATVAVTPTVASHVALADPDMRLRQYQESLRWWAEFTASAGVQLHIVETTGARSSDVLASVPMALRRNIGWSAHVPTPRANAMGKGAVEMEAVSGALRSDLANLGPLQTLFKVTGRLIVSNAADVIRPAQPNEVLARRTLDGTYVDTRIFGMPVQIWRRYLIGSESLVRDDEGLYLEHAVAACLARPSMLRDLKLTRFDAVPRFVGTSGSTGVDYGSGLSLRRLAAVFDRCLLRLAHRKQV